MSAPKTITAVRQLEAENGFRYPSQLDSFLKWRSRLSVSSYWDQWYPYTNGLQYWQMSESQVIAATYAKLGRKQAPICPQCEGRGMIKLEDGSNLWCLCQALPWANRKAKDVDEWRSPYMAAKFSDYETKNDPMAKLGLVAALKRSREFADNPQNWLILSGGVGTGKTHLLRAVASNYGPIALYIRAADLSSAVFRETSGGDLPALIGAVQKAPILLLDDLGAEYRKDYLLSMLLNVVDYRYAHMAEYPTMVTTNANAAALRTTWERLGDRLADKVNNFIEISAASYRQSAERRAK